MDYTEKSEKIQSPAVAIDGTKARAIREAKKLTQLYVASVVGVTTDTISRWENNRYPSIKRDNAEKLASALEVDLDEIRRDGEPAEPVPASSDAQSPSPEAPRPSLRYGVISVVIAAMVVAGFFWFRQQRNAPEATRILPLYAAPGNIIPIKIKLHRQAGDTRGVIIKEQLPTGWTFVKSSPPSMAIGPKQELKWLVPPGAADISILYAVLLPVTEQLDHAVSFSGKIIVQENGSHTSAPVGGARQTTVAGRHWADQNGDTRIDDTEIMPAYYLTEEFKGFGLDWKEIETIWNSRGYVWDQTNHTMRPLP